MTMSDIKWIKICTDIFDDEKILLIEGMPEADSIIVIWFKLLCLAGKQNNSGVFMLNDRIPYTDKMLATIFRRKESTVTMALRTFEDFGMIEIVDGAITIPKWGKHQSLDKIEKKNEYQKEYMREYRKKQKLLACGAALDDGKDKECKTNVSVNGNANVSCAEEEKEEEREGEQKKKTRKASPTVTDDKATEMMEPTNISEPLREKVLEWLQYKREIGNTYKETGFKSLLKQVEQAEQKHGASAVMNQIDLAMSRSWQGMYLDKIVSSNNNNTAKKDSFSSGLDMLMNEGWFND
jgi:predicted phage replisome organizer